MECREEYKYNSEAIEFLIKNNIVTMHLYDAALASSMENGQNYMAVTLAMQLVQKMIVDGKGSYPVTESDLSNTIDALAKISTQSRQAPDG